MSLNTLQQQIAAIIKSTAPEVIALKGDWGVGKTYSWNKWLTDAKDGQSIGLDRYCYVSLFGVNSIDDIKTAIFQQSIPINQLGKEFSVDQVFNNFKRLDSFKDMGEAVFRRGARAVAKVTSVAGNVGGKIANEILQPLSFLTVSKTLICIDDIERRGNGIELKDFLGLLSFLKEHRDCKIIILLNEDVKGLEDYSVYKEKVLDFELKFSPSAKECAEIAFPDKNNHSHLCFRERSIELGIKNIRVLKKMLRLYEQLESHINSFSEELAASIIHSLALYVWSNYCSGEHAQNIPSLDYIFNEYPFGQFNSNKEMTEKEKSWQSVLNLYGYTGANELDDYLVEYIKAGYLDVARFNQLALSVENLVFSNKAAMELREAWETFSWDFMADQHVVVSKLVDTFNKNISNYFF